MSEKLTRIRLAKPTAFNGLMDWGVCSVEQMLAQARAYSAHLRREADAIDAAADDDFEVCVVRGSVVQHHLETLQEGRGQ